MANDVGKRVEVCRLKKGWTQAELAKRATLGPRHLWNILHGQRPRLEAETVRKLAVALEVSTDYLLGLQESFHGH